MCFVIYSFLLAVIIMTQWLLGVAVMLSCCHAVKKKRVNSKIHDNDRYANSKVFLKCIFIYYIIYAGIYAYFHLKQ